MAKQSGYLQRIHAQKEAEMKQTYRFARQLMVDMACIALNTEFGFGADRLQRFYDRLMDTYVSYADLWNADTKDTVYSREKLDRKLKQILGESNFTPWEIRYGR